MTSRRSEKGSYESGKDLHGRRAGGETKNQRSVWGGPWIFLGGHLYRSAQQKRKAGYYRSGRTQLNVPKQAMVGVVKKTAWPFPFDQGKKGESLSGAEKNEWLEGIQDGNKGGAHKIRDLRA